MGVALHEGSAVQEYRRSPEVTIKISPKIEKYFALDKPMVGRSPGRRRCRQRDVRPDQLAASSLPSPAGTAPKKHRAKAADIDPEFKSGRAGEDVAHPLAKIFGSCAFSSGRSGAMLSAQSPSSEPVTRELSFAVQAGGRNQPLRE